MRLAGDADLTADQPSHLCIEMNGPGLEVLGGGDQNGKRNLVFVAEVHQGTQRKPARDRKLHGAGGDTGGQRPGDLWWFARVAGVDPIDVPLLLKRKDKPDLQGSAGSNRRRERYQLRGQMLCFNRPWASITDRLNLSASRAEQGAEKREEEDKGSADFHRLNCR
jgi:hypothetical protein